MAQEYKKGDRVTWNFGRGQAVGTVQLTSRTKIGNENVAASEDDPRYVVKSEKSARRPPTSPAPCTRRS